MFFLNNVQKPLSCFNLRGIFESDPIKQTIMPKPKGQKNTKNKTKHTKLLNQKINKQKAEKALRKERLKAIITKAKE